MQDAVEPLTEIDPDDLAVLGGRYESTVGEVESLSSAMSTLTRTSRVLPDIMGADRPRRYLVLVQNNAEPRALGGIPGSVIELSIDDGQIELVGQRPGGDFPTARRPILPLSQSEQDLYGEEASPRHPQRHRHPRLRACRAWPRPTGKPTAADRSTASWPSTRSPSPPCWRPPARSRSVTGRELPPNAAQFLLNEVYFDIPEDRQDRYFARVAAALFEHVTGGSDFDLPEAVDGLVDATAQGRFLFWSRFPAESEVVAGTRLAGPLDDPEKSTVGVFLHDRTQSKMGYYQDVRASVTPMSCDPSNDTLVVSVDVANTAPEDGKGLPPYVTAPSRRAARRHRHPPSSSTPRKRHLHLVRRQRRTHAGPGARAPGPRGHLGPGGPGARRDRALAYRVEDADLSNGFDVRMTPGPPEGQLRATGFECSESS